MAEDIQINAKEALKCIRGPMSNADVMERFKITSKGYADLLRQLFRKKLITEEDLARRGISFTIAPKKGHEPALPPVALAAPVALAPPPSPDDEEFLDTAALTDLLSFKSSMEPGSGTPDGPAEIGSPGDEVESTQKKAKYGVAGLFKKSG